MHNFDSLRKPAVLGAAIVVGAIGLRGLDIDLPSIPGFSAPGIDQAQLDSTSRLNDLRLVRDVLLIRGTGDTSTSIDAKLRYTGFRKPLNRLGGRGLHTSVEQDGEIQLGIKAGGIIEDEKQSADPHKPFGVTVNTSKIFNQVVSLGLTKTKANDGIVVQARSIFHEDEARREERGDELEHYGRKSFQYKCGQEALPVVEAGVEEWVRAQEQVSHDKDIDVTFRDNTGNHVAITGFRLPQQKLKTPKEIMDKLYGDKADDIEITDVTDKPCVLSTEVIDQINQINGEKPKPAVH